MNEELSKPLPEVFCNFAGKACPPPYPKNAILIARMGCVFMFSVSKTKFAVVYGLQLHPSLSRDAAASTFGQCCMHQAEAEGLLISSEP